VLLSNPFIVQLRCSCIALILQLLTIPLFIESPTLYSVVLHVIPSFSILVAGLLLNRSRISWNSAQASCFYVNASLRLLISYLIVYLCILPDIVSAFKYSLDTVDIRHYLLSGEIPRVLPPQLLLLLCAVCVGFSLYIFNFIRFARHKYVLNLLVIFVVISQSFIWASRTDIVIFVAFSLLWRPLRVSSRLNLFTLRYILLLTLVPLLLAFYTTIVQKRDSLENTFAASIFYLCYFAYPLYMQPYVQDIFRDAGPLYSLIGYPYDVAKAFLAGSDSLVTYMPLISIRSVIGADIFGGFHDSANVLYSLPSFLEYSFGLLGVFGYYVILSMLLVYIFRFTGSFPVFYFLSFFFFFEGARIHPLLTPTLFFVFIPFVLLELKFSS